MNLTYDRTVFSVIHFLFKLTLVIKFKQLDIVCSRINFNIKIFINKIVKIQFEVRF